MISMNWITAVAILYFYIAPYGNILIHLFLLFLKLQFSNDIIINDNEFFKTADTAGMTKNTFSGLHFAFFFQ